MRRVRIRTTIATMKPGNESDHTPDGVEAASTRHVREPPVPKVNSDHRETLSRIFAHPSSANIEWRQVRSLLEAVGTVREHHNGKIEATVGPTTEVLQPPHGKDVDRQMILDLRRLLRGMET